VQTSLTENYILDHAALLIVSDDVEFSRSVTGRWQAERTLPTFTLMGSDLCRGRLASGDSLNNMADGPRFDAAIVGDIDPLRLSSVLQTLQETGKPILLVCEEKTSAQAKDETQPRLMTISRHDGWLDTIVLVMTETIRRRDAVERGRELDHKNRDLEHDATLGRYMLEMRHTLNNALTSILGNSELLLLEPGTLSAQARSQMETIRNMSLRMNEVLQRFTSLEKELSVVKAQAEKDSVRASAAGL